MIKRFVMGIVGTVGLAFILSAFKHEDKNKKSE